jgi:aminoglycoside 6-adenylyltransferase
MGQADPRRRPQSPIAYSQRMERHHGWSVPAGKLGKGLKKRLPPEVWEALEGTYACAGIADNWEALFRTMALFRRVGIEVAADLGYTYPLDLDRRVTAYVRQIRSLDRDPGSYG